MLAENIGERNVNRPDALAAAAAYIGNVWKEQGYRALMVTDTAFYRYAHYHAASDLPDELDYASMATVTEGVAHAMASLAMERE